jgi:hypothetical protein
MRVKVRFFDTDHRGEVSFLGDRVRVTFTQVFVDEALIAGKFSVDEPWRLGTRTFNMVEMLSAEDRNADLDRDCEEALQLVMEAVMQ